MAWAQRGQRGNVGNGLLREKAVPGRAASAAREPARGSTFLDAFFKIFGHFPFFTIHSVPR